MDTIIKNKLLYEIADMIHAYPTFIATIEVHLYKSIGLPFNAPPFTNFRDSFTHYEKMYMADSYEDVIKQNFAILEHLNRGASDSIVYFIQELINILNELESKDAFKVLSPLNKNFLRKIKHQIKNICLDIRLNNVKIIGILDDTSVVDDLNTALKSLKQYLIVNGLYEYFKSIIEEREQNQQK